MVGTMIELPRAALMAGKIAEEAEFFSFGTNDLTQTTFGLSRDDSGNFLPHYQKAVIFEQDPFVIDPAALSDLNEVRTRANLSELFIADFAGDPDRFYDSIIVERNRELLYEGVIFHDLKRQAANGLSVRITNSNLDPLDDRFILPIPQSECDASPGLCD